MKNILIILMMVLVGTGLAFADMDQLGDYEKTHAILSAGYNWVETEDVSGRAAEYMYQDSSGTAAFEIKGGQDDMHFILDGDYRNENDYAFGAHFDRNNAQRLDLRIEKMYHNLDHIDYNSRPTAEFISVLPVNPTTVTRADFFDNNPTDEYSLKASTYEANFRTKLPDMPSHFNLGYWQYRKEGHKQMRFVDENCAGACHLQSETRELDRTTSQITGGFDAHLGKFDLILNHTYREITVDEPVPESFFDDHSRLRPGAGFYQHSEDPESQVNETTLEVHSSLAGGVNIAVSGTYGKRKNQSIVTDAAPIIAETEYWKATTDVTHMTSAKFSYNFKMRHLDMDADNNYPQLIDPFTSGVSGIDLVDVRPPIDLKRTSYELNTSYRPNKKITYKGNLKVEQIKRSDTGSALPFHSNSGGVFVNDPVWELPDKEIITTAKLGFFARPMGVSSVKLNGHYKYQHSDDPAYGASFEDSHELFLSTTYSINPTWGLNASARATFETSDNHIHEVIFDEGPPLITNNLPTDRDRDQESVNIGTWFNPTQTVTTTLNYGYNRTAITQDLIFGVDPNNSATGSAVDYIIQNKDVDFLQEMHTVSGSASIVLSGNVKSNISAYYTRSLSYYDPDFATQTFQYQSGGTTLESTASSDSLKQISQYDIDQYGVKAGVDYYFTPDFELSLNYTYDDYNEKYSSDFDGSVQTAMGKLAYRF